MKKRFLPILIIIAIFISLMAPLTAMADNPVVVRNTAELYAALDNANAVGAGTILLEGDAVLNRPTQTIGTNVTLIIGKDSVLAFESFIALNVYGTVALRDGGVIRSDFSAFELHTRPSGVLNFSGGEWDFDGSLSNLFDHHGTLVLREGQDIPLITGEFGQIIRLCNDCLEFPCDCPVDLCDDCGKYPCACPELCDEYEWRWGRNSPF